MGYSLMFNCQGLKVFRRFKGESSRVLKNMVDHRHNARGKQRRREDTLVAVEHYGDESSPCCG